VLFKADSEKCFISLYFFKLVDPYNVYNGFLAVVIDCYFYDHNCYKLTYDDHKMIIEHHNSQSYDEVMTKLRRICDDFMIIIIFFEWPLMIILLVYLYMFSVHYLIFLSMDHAYAYVL